ncbi:MAG: hypothetical protein LBH55_04300 [Mycoplasmataceae bacterium]|jgi:hypothetical protein|nr:hypothetical protein [Mycoplasmataceae bacterium]
MKVNKIFLGLGTLFGITLPILTLNLTSCSNIMSVFEFDEVNGYTNGVDRFLNRNKLSYLESPDDEKANNILTLSAESIKNNINAYFLRNCFVNYYSSLQYKEDTPTEEDFSNNGNNAIYHSSKLSMNIEKHKNFYITITEWKHIHTLAGAQKDEYDLKFIFNDEKIEFEHKKRGVNGAEDVVTKKEFVYDAEGNGIFFNKSEENKQLTINISSSTLFSFNLSKYDWYNIEFTTSST